MHCNSKKVVLKGDVMIVKKYSVKREKTPTVSKLHEIIKKNERYWSLVAQHEITAAQIKEKKNNVVGQETEIEFTEYLPILVACASWGLLYGK